MYLIKSRLHAANAPLNVTPMTDTVLHKFNARQIIVIKLALI